ncbi:MAG: hypothetical protein HC819_19280 [Cyclobacteriaceae bacterium]|nr:hypothetical protein [Cyclobacteriaceae bacterium]
MVLNNIKHRSNLYTNSRGCKVLGFTQGELIRMGDGFFSFFFHQDDIKDLFRQWHRFIEDEDTERVYGFFQRVRTFKNDDWEWFFTAGKFRKDDLSKTIFIAHSVSDMPQLMNRFDRVLEEETFYRKNYERFQSLTKREKEILQHIASGDNCKTISDKLFISELTIYTHRKRIIQKLDAKNLTDLVKYARVFGLVK